jgi:hypothetical protein
VRARGREWVRRGRMRCWGVEQCILVQEKDIVEGDESKDVKMMVKMVVFKKMENKDNRNKNKNEN